MKKNSAELLINQAKFVTERLEKFSPDSIWARQASGVRGALLRKLSKLENSILLDRQPVKEGEMEYLRSLVDRSYELLEKAAREY